MAARYSPALNHRRYRLVADPTEVTIRVHVQADVSRVWEALISPQAIVQWNFAIPEWHCPRAVCDPVVGGKYIYRMEARDGSSPP